MEKKICIVSILIEDPDSTKAVNDLLHAYAPFIVGRFGLPYLTKNLSILSVVFDAPPDQVNALSGKLGRLPGITSKTLQTTK